MAFGTQSTGFIAKTIDDIRSSLNSGMRNVFGLAVNVDPRARLGQLIGIFAEEAGEVWQLGEALSNALNPRAATGLFLDYLCAITGTVRKPATNSKVTLVLIGTPATLVAAGKRAAVNGTSVKFALDAPATILAATAWAGATTYATGAIRTNGGNLYRAKIGGVSGGVGPSGTGDFVDGTVTWRFLGAGTAYVEAAASATVTGPLQGFAESVTIIDTPVGGWNLVINPLDAVPGTNIEADWQLRLRREQEIGAQASSTVAGVRQKVTNVAGVTSCTVFENVTDVTVDSMPPHSIEVLVEGGVDADIATAIFESRAAGIKPYGTTIASVNDSEGVGHEANFSRPAVVDAHVEITLSYDAAAYPINGETQVKAAIVSAGDALKLGRDIVPSLIGAFVISRVDSSGNQIGIPGVINVSVRVKTTGAYQTTPIVLSNRERADYDTSRVTVIASAGLP